jgi:E3 ubiquitin-protein ligase MGRN1
MGNSSSRQQAPQQQQQPPNERPQGGGPGQGQSNPNTNPIPGYNQNNLVLGPQQIHPQPYPHPRAAAPYYVAPPHYPYSPYPYHSPPTNGQFYTGGPPIRPPPQNYLPPAPMPISVQEPQRTAPIRNDVNLKKQSLRLEKDEANPGFWLVAFSLDASLAGR